MTSASKTGDVWDRWAWAWHGGALVVISFAAVTAAARGDWVAVAAAALMAVWFWVGRSLGHDRWPLTAVHLGVLVASALVFSWRVPTFLAVSGFLTGHLFGRLPIRIAAVLTLIACAVMGARLADFLGAAGWLAASAAAAISLLLAVTIDGMARQSDERRKLIAELESTRRELAVREREEGIRRERHRLARELHDTVTQDLISVIRLVESARLAHDGENPAQVTEKLELAERVARDGLAEARSIASAQADAVPGGDLAASLERLCDRFRCETGVEIELVVESRFEALPTVVGVALLRVAQEALANVRKYAAATRVTVSVTDAGGQIALHVCDDGIGFDPGQIPPTRSAGGFGLAGIRDRVDELEGRFIVDSSHGAGTNVGVEIPVGGQR